MVSIGTAHIGGTQGAGALGSTTGDMHHEGVGEGHEGVGRGAGTGVGTANQHGRRLLKEWRRLTDRTTPERRYHEARRHLDDTARIAKRAPILADGCIDLDRQDVHFEGAESLHGIGSGRIHSTIGVTLH